MSHSQGTSLCIASPGRHASLCRVPRELLPVALTGRTTHQKAYRGHCCLTGRTTTNGPQGALLPHGEDNHQWPTGGTAASRGGQPPMAHRGHGCLTGRTTTNGPQGAWLPHGEDNHQWPTGGMAASRGGQLPMAHRGHGCLTGRTTTNGPQGAKLPRMEDNHQRTHGFQPRLNVSINDSLDDIL